jgi:DnaJ-class molecular chaperone
MADDPYKTLGVARDATEQQVRKAYLKLAKTTHPDLNPGNAQAEERFKAVNAAHDLLQDTEQRARFDRGEIDGVGQPRPPPGPPPGARRYREHAEGAAGARYSAGMGMDGDDLGDILSGMFGARGRGGFGANAGAGPLGGADRRYSLAVSFLDAVRGGSQRLTLPDGGSLDVRIPAGLNSGQVLRLRGKGAPGDPPGDALIEVEVSPHPLFRREGRDIHLDLPVTVPEAVLGGRVTVPTIDGPVSMAVPSGSSTGTRLRLRGRGVPAAGGQPAGDAYATLRIMLAPSDPGLADFLKNRADAPDWNPRTGMEGTS